MLIVYFHFYAAAADNPIYARAMLPTIFPHSFKTTAKKTIVPRAWQECVEIVMKTVPTSHIQSAKYKNNEFTTKTTTACKSEEEEINCCQ
jgi:hypothetical protein